MACNVTISSVRGERDAGVLQRIIVSGTAQECKEVLVKIKCAGNSIERTVGASSGRWTAQFDNTSSDIPKLISAECACDETILVEANCIKPDTAGPCKDDSITRPLDCPGPVVCPTVEWEIEKSPCEDCRQSISITVTIDSKGYAVTEAILSDGNGNSQPITPNQPGTFTITLNAAYDPGLYKATLQLTTDPPYDPVCKKTNDTQDPNNPDPPDLYSFKFIEAKCGKKGDGPDILKFEVIDKGCTGQDTRRFRIEADLKPKGVPTTAGLRLDTQTTALAAQNNTTTPFSLTADIELPAPGSHIVSLFVTNPPCCDTATYPISVAGCSPPITIPAIPDKVDLPPYDRTGEVLCLFSRGLFTAAMVAAFFFLFAGICMSALATLGWAFWGFVASLAAAIIMLLVWMRLCGSPCGALILVAETVFAGGAVVLYFSNCCGILGGAAATFAGGMLALVVAITLFLVWVFACKIPPCSYLAELITAFLTASVVLFVGMPQVPCAITWVPIVLSASATVLTAILVATCTTGSPQPSPKPHGNSASTDSGKALNSTTRRQSRRPDSTVRSVVSGSRKNCGFCNQVRNTLGIGKSLS